ncbi:MAG: hypothetical protein ABJQ29_16520 [Luteolibacter sp.]
MERFEIEDIVEQDTHGVVFRARITSSGTPVAIRRFFPFGRDGDGLEAEEAVAFGIAASRLAKLYHPALRGVVEGSVDPIDGMPYLVSEWIEGEPLPDILKGEKLDPASVIDVMRLALEVSLLLSNVLGEEALWIETDPESILVGTVESGRGFTFWISPFKWLGAQTKPRNLSDLVTLGEGLAGWSNKLVSEQAGNGLGSWFKWLKANPETGLREALETLAASTGKEPPPSDDFLVKAATAKPATMIKQPSSKTPLLITGALALLVLGVALTYLHVTASAPVIEEDFAQQKISDVIIAAEVPKEELPPETEEQVAKKTQPPTSASADIASAPEIFELQSNQLAKMRSLKVGTAITLTGTLEKIDLSRNKNIIILNFEGKKGTPLIRALIPKDKYQDEFSLKPFKRFLGKTITANGSSMADNTKKSRDVVITRFKDISVVQPIAKQTVKTPSSDESTNSALSPDDREAIEALDDGTAVSLTGVLDSNRFSGSKKSIYLEFASDIQQSIWVVIHQRDYDGDYSLEAFDTLAGKNITVRGTVFKDNFGNPAQVKVLAWDDITAAP